jgi:hypothetical protein
VAEVCGAAPLAAVAILSRPPIAGGGCIACMAGQTSGRVGLGGLEIGLGLWVGVRRAAKTWSAPSKIETECKTAVPSQAQGKGTGSASFSCLVKADTGRSPCPCRGCLPRQGHHPTRRALLPATFEFRVSLEWKPEHWPATLGIPHRRIASALPRAVAAENHASAF